MSNHKPPRPIRFAVCSDVHQDIMHDAEERLRAFVERARREKVDFIIQLGDFCRPYDYNRSFMDIWDGYEGRRVHVLGNHDMDGGFSRDDVMDYWRGMPARYYAFDVEGWHFIVLDGNDPCEDGPSGYPRSIAPDQLAWLREDLEATNRPTVLFSHQTVEDGQGLVNAAEVRDLLERENRRAGWKKVGISINGHDHVDHAIRINDIDYMHVNSMSNYWLGEKYMTVRYGEANDKEFPWIKYTAPYREAIYGIVHLEPEGLLTIEGVESEFVGPSPWDLGFRVSPEVVSYPDEAVAARVSSREWKVW